MRKTQKLLLNRETLRYLSSGPLRGAAGGATTPITHCAVSACIETCAVICYKTQPPVCSERNVCGL